MKKLLLLFCFPLLFSCGKTIEEKATDLALSKISTDMPSIRNCKALSVKIEPLYNSVMFIDGIVDSLYLVAALDSLKGQFQNEYDYLYKDSMDWRRLKGYDYNFPEPFRSFVYFNVGADTLGFTMDDLMDSMSDLDMSIDSLSFHIMSKYENLDVSKLFGWRVIQKYSATNDIGRTYEDSLSFIMTTDYDIWKGAISSVNDMDSVLLKLGRHIDFVKDRFKNRK